MVPKVESAEFSGSVKETLYMADIQLFLSFSGSLTPD